MWQFEFRFQPQPTVHHIQVDIIQDNSGYELFGDLCLAEVLLRTTKLTSVRFHMKCIPWFKSDVTEADMQQLITSFKGKIRF